MKGIVIKFIVLNKKRKIPISEKPACLTATVDHLLSRSFIIILLSPISEFMMSLFEDLTSTKRQKINYITSTTYFCWSFNCDLA